MTSVIELIRAAKQRGTRLVSSAPPSVPMPPGPFQGYIDERSTHHVAGWVRNLSNAVERLDVEAVLPDGTVTGERVLARAHADVHSAILVEVGVGDGCYAFAMALDPPLDEASRDTVFVRPVGTAHRLELAPALRTVPPGVPPPPPPGPFQGYVDERSVHHVAGWVRDLSDLDRRVDFEIVVADSTGETVLRRGRADAFSGVLRTVGVGDGRYSFYVLFEHALTEAERDAVFVRPRLSQHRLELAPELKTVFQPISHIAMDIVNNCNLRCPFCVYDYVNTKHTYFMSDAIFDASLRLIPYVTDGNFWLSCLHEATLHPQLVSFIERVPAAYRGKLFYTTNLAKRMPQSYFDFLAGSAMHHINVSMESFDPAIYERLRQGARYRIFVENWDRMLAAFAAGAAPPRVRYNLMAYRSNLHEIPGMVDVLLREKHAWQVEIRHTYDEPHIPSAFRRDEFLTTEEWAWLADALRHHSPDDVVLLLPPDGVGHDEAGPAADGAAATASPPEAAAASADYLPISRPSGQYDAIPRPINISMDWDGTMRIYGEQPRGAGQPPLHMNYVMTNIAFLKNPLRFILSL